MTQRIGLFGGSFNPIHHGHLIVARAVAEQLDLSRVILLPTTTPPHKPPSDKTEGRHRAEIVKRAIEGDPLFEFSDYDLNRPGPTYTIETVRHFRSTLDTESAPTPNDAASAADPPDLYWLIGADSLADLPDWHRANELVDLCQIVTATRPGAPPAISDTLRRTFSAEQVEKLDAGVLETPAIDISSTDIRDRVRRGLSIRYLVPEKVATYIATHGLYRA